MAFGGSGFFATPAVSAGGYVRSIAVRTRVSCWLRAYANKKRRQTGLIVAIRVADSSPIMCVQLS
jgi:hypothetical protein